MNDINHWELDVREGIMHIPEDLCRVLGYTIFITVSQFKTLAVYLPAEWKALKRQTWGMSREKKKKLRPIFKHAVKIKINNGNLIIPPIYMDFVGIKDRAVVVVKDRYCAITEPDCTDDAVAYIKHQS